MCAMYADVFLRGLRARGRREQDLSGKLVFLWLARLVTDWLVIA